MQTQLDIVRAYHERTKHRLGAFARGPEYLDWENQPDPFRVYQGCVLTELPLLETEQAPDPGHLSLTTVANLLELSLGLSAWKQYGPNRWALRCNPSSGNLHPTEGYVICNAIDGLQDGVHHYAPHDHVLEQRGIISAPTNTDPALFIGLSSIIWREAWKYGERAFRYVQLDVGHAIATVKYAASTLQLQVAIVSIDDDSLAALLGLNREQDFHHAEREHPDVLLKITAGQDNQPFIAPQIDHWTGKANPLGGDPHHEWKVLEEIAQATWNKKTRPQSNNTASFDTTEFKTCIDQSSQSPTSLIRQRRSGQAFSAKTSTISQNEFYCILNALLIINDASSPRHWDFPALLHPVIFVHRVNGLESGLYALPRHQQSFQQMQQIMDNQFLWAKPDNCPSELPLYQLSNTDVRKQARSISCHQEIASSSAFSLGILAEFDEALATGPEAYRQLYWEAGFLGHQLYLQAEAIGKRGTGIGCFFDDEFHLLLGLEDSMFQDMYHFTVGDPVNDERLQTLPPYMHLKNRDMETSRLDHKQMQVLKQKIAETVKQRETVKQQLESGQIKPKIGFAELGNIDTKLSQLDTRFKTLWDKYNSPSDSLY
jgi:SagB-type dehydrogenase family enzyme